MPFDPLHNLSILAAHPLAHLNALLNCVAGVLLVAGYILIRKGHETAHKRTMLVAFAVSCAFLTSYLAYHFIILKGGSVPFGRTGAVRYVYYTILISHIILAATVPVLAIRTIYLGLRDRREKHRRVARWTLPIWLYVSVTGVLVYLMLYHLYPSSAS